MAALQVPESLREGVSLDQSRAETQSGRDACINEWCGHT